MIINDGAPVYEHFYSDFVDMLKNKTLKIYHTSYRLHVYDTSKTHIYHPGTDNATKRNAFLSNVFRQIAIDGVAIILCTNEFGKRVYIIASDD